MKTFGFFTKIVDFYVNGEIASLPELGIELPSREQVAKETAATVGAKNVELSDVEYNGILETQRGVFASQLLGQLSIDTLQRGKATLYAQLQEEYKSGRDFPSLRQFYGVLSSHLLLRESADRSMRSDEPSRH